MNATLENEAFDTSYFNNDNPVFIEQEQHLNTIPKEELKNLYQLFDSLKNFDSERNAVYSSTFSELHKKLYDLKLVFNFKWMDWKQGHQNLKDPNFNLSACSLLQVCMYLTVIFRSDRFCEGTIECRYKDGTLEKLFAVLKK